MLVRAYAKINLSLEVLGRRDDGYHEIASVLQLVSLHDTLSFTLAGDLSLSCQSPGLDTDSNLVMRAARLLKRKVDSPLAAAISLEKRIPLAAGLGGGSSDAAATLSALNKMWRLHLSHRHLADLGAELGSDVPFFLDGATALAGGRGEVVSPLSPPDPAFVVLVVPSIQLVDKTRALYASLAPDDYSDGSRTRALAEQLAARAGIDTTLMVNAFERAACQMFPEVRRCRDLVSEAGGEWSMLSGSGPARFTLFHDERRALQVYDRLRPLCTTEGVAIFLLTTLTASSGARLR